MKTPDSIMESLDNKERERAQATAGYKNEIAAAKAKIEVLTAEQENAATPDDFKATAREIQDTRDYIAFLEKKLKTINGPAVSKQEYKDIELAINEANEKAAEQAAPKILEKANELLKLLDEYDKEADQLQHILNRAQQLTFGRPLGGYTGHLIAEKVKDRFLYMPEMLAAYFRHREIYKAALRATDKSRLTQDERILYEILNEKRGPGRPRKE